MQVFNSTFANRRQRFRSLDGTIFAGRYKSLLVDTDAWLLQVSLYIHLNPVRARMTTDPASYEWSSCQDYLSGKQKKRYGVLVDPVLHMIANTSKDQIRQYRTLLQENLTCELPPTHRGVCYAECDLAETMDQLIEDQSNTKHESDILCWKLDSTELIDLILEITNNKRADLFERKRNNIPKLLVCHALHKLTPLTLKEIGKILEMTFHAVSDSSKRFENKRKTTKQYQEYWQKLQQQISNINSKLEL
jgi:hypothetical protein